MLSDGEKLVRAAAKGDDAKVKRLLKANVDVNIGLANDKDANANITALMEAATDARERTVCASRLNRGSRVLCWLISN